MTLLHLHTDLLDHPIRIELDDDGPAINQDLLQSLPFDSTLGHVVVSGGGIWVPTRFVFTGTPNWVQRRQGTVYFYAPGQSLCIWYGAVTESSGVNRLGEVVASDLEDLVELGRSVWQRTIQSAQRPPVGTRLTRASEVAA